MRTKALLLTAAIGAAGIATSMAQVYSVNAVGYVNTQLTNTPAADSFFLLSNPLNGTNNNIATILPTVPAGTAVYKYDTNVSDFATEGFINIPGVFTGWSPGTTTLAPGEGFFISIPAGTTSPQTLTFVGEVPQGTLATRLLAGFNMVGSQVPQQGAVSSVLGLTAAAGDSIYVFDPAIQDYVTYGYIDIPGVFTGWSPEEPVMSVAQGFWFFNGGIAKAWSRTFTVN